MTTKDGVGRAHIEFDTWDELRAYLADVAKLRAQAEADRAALARMAPVVEAGLAYEAAVNAYSETTSEDANRDLYAAEVSLFLTLDAYRAGTPAPRSRLTVDEARAIVGLYEEAGELGTSYEPEVRAAARVLLREARAMVAECKEKT